MPLKKKDYLSSWKADHSDFEDKVALFMPAIVTALTTTIRASDEDPVTRKPPQNGHHSTPFTAKPLERKSVHLTYTERFDSDEKPTYASEVQSEDNQTDDKLIKDKLVNLLLSSKKDIVQRMKKVDSIHDVYKSEKFYKVGYLVSFVNKLYKRLISSYTDIEENKYKWSVLRILNAYNEVKNSNDFLKEMLRVMQAVLTTHHKLRRRQVKLRQPLALDEKQLELLVLNTKNSNSKKGYSSNSISWSYYDENIGN